MNYRTRRASRAGGAAALVLVITVTGMLVNQVHLGDRADRNENTANQAITGLTDANKQIGKLDQTVKEANRRLDAAGQPTVPVPATTPIEVPVLPDGLTSAQNSEVRQIVIAELAQQKVTLPPDEVAQIARVAAGLVPKPKDGKTPTPEQLRAIAEAAVKQFCAADKCVGKTGEPGATVTGPPGKDAPPVTDEQLAARVIAYCAAESNPCRGPVGPEGPAGPSGPAGRGIVTGPTCTGEGADSYWITTYTDGTEQRQDGPCRAASILPPAPTAK